MVDAKAYTSTEFERSGTKMKIANSANWRKTCVKYNLFELAAEYEPYMERRIANEECPNAFSEEYWRVKICFEFWHRDHWEQTRQSTQLTLRLLCSTIVKCSWIITSIQNGSRPLIRQSWRKNKE